MSQQADLEQRVDRIEQLLDRVIALAAEHALGRKILAKLGLD